MRISKGPRTRGPNVEETEPRMRPCRWCSCSGGHGSASGRQGTGVASPGVWIPLCPGVGAHLTLTPILRGKWDPCSGREGSGGPEKSRDRPPGHPALWGAGSGCKRAGHAPEQRWRRGSGRGRAPREEGTAERRPGGVPGSLNSSVLLGPKKQDTISFLPCLDDAVSGPERAQPGLSEEQAGTGKGGAHRGCLWPLYDPTASPQGGSGRWKAGSCSTS